MRRLIFIAFVLLAWPSLSAAADCGTGLAAEDLSGTCRATPQATMGALEATGTTTTANPDANGYTSIYECYSGGAKCGIDMTPPACEQTITTATTPTGDWTAINQTANNVICIEPGDYTARGVLTLNVSYSSTFKWLRYTRTADDGDKPWIQTSGNRAKLAGLSVQANGWVVQRLTFDGTGKSAGSTLIDVPATSPPAAGKSWVVFDQVLAENGPVNLVKIGSGNDTIFVQNSVLRSCTATVGHDLAAVTSASPRTVVVRSETYDCTHGVAFTGSNMSGAVIEANDIRLTTARYTNCSGTPDVNGTCAAAEALVLVSGNASAQSPIQIRHNRLEGARVRDGAACCTGSDVTGGAALAVFGDYVLAQNNIIRNSQIGARIDSPADHVSLVGNLYYAINAYKGADPSRVVTCTGCAATENYLSTLVDNAGSWIDFDGTATNLDARCNVSIASGAATHGTPGSGVQVDANAFFSTTAYSTAGSPVQISVTLGTWAASTAYTLGQHIRVGNYVHKVTQNGTSAGTAPTWGTRRGGITNDNTVRWTLVIGPYNYYRYLQTGQLTTGFLAYSGLGASHAQWCSAPGTRAGIGVDDRTAW